MITNRDYLTLLALLASNEVAESHFGKEPCPTCAKISDLADAMKLPEARDFIACTACHGRMKVPTLAGLEGHCQIVADYIEDEQGLGRPLDPRIGLIRWMATDGCWIGDRAEMPGARPPTKFATPLAARREYRRRVWEMLTEPCPACHGGRSTGMYASPQWDCHFCHGFGFVGTEAEEISQYRIMPNGDVV